MNEAATAAAGTEGTGTAAATTTGTAGATTGTTTGTTAIAAAAPPVNYFANADAESLGWAQNKGLIGADPTKADLAKFIPEILKHGRNVESLVGRNRLPMPRDEADTEARETIFKALGRPADPAGYEITLPEGADEAGKGYFNGMLTGMHQLGLTKSQAQGVAKLSEQLSAQVSEQRAAAEAAAYTAKTAAELGAVRTEWGAQADSHFAAAQRFTQAFGVKQDTMEKIERAIGTKEMLTLFSNIGHGLTEDRSAGVGNAAVVGAGTPEAARARLSELQADSGWIKKFQAGEAGAVAEYKKLTNILASA